MKKSSLATGFFQTSFRFTFRFTKSAFSRVALYCLVFFIASCDSGGGGYSSLIVPGNLQATAGDGQVILQWNASIGATAYKVYYHTSSFDSTSDSGVVLWSTQPTSASVTVTGLDNYTQYFFRVSALTKNGESALSREARTIPTPPVAPNGLSAVAGDAQVTVSWFRVNNTNGYRLYIDDTSTSADVDRTIDIVQDSDNRISHTVNDLTNDTLYSFRLSTLNASGESKPSSKVTAVPVAPPVAPNGLAAVIGDSQITVSWNRVSNARSYRLYIDDTSTSADVDRIIGFDQSSGDLVHTLTDLVNGTQYAFLVIAINSSGEALTNQITATPIATPALSATSGDGLVSLQWTSAAGATAYKVYYHTSSFDNTSDATLWSTQTDTSIDVTGLLNGTRYYFRVTGINSSGEALSNQITATPVASPTSLVATSGNGSVSLHWTAAAGATSYKVYYHTSSFTDTSTATLWTSQPTDTSVDVTGLVNGTRYYFRVTGINSSGESALSNQITATPIATPALSATSGNGSVSLRWTAAAGATAYKVYYHTSSFTDTSTATLLTSQPTDTSVDVTGLVNGTRYYFRVTGINSSGESALSNIASAIPLPLTFGVQSRYAPNGLPASRIGAGDFSNNALFRFSDMPVGWNYATVVNGHANDSTALTLTSAASSISVASFSANPLQATQWNRLRDGAVTVTLKVWDATSGMSEQQAQSYIFTTTKEQYTLKSWQDVQGIDHDLSGDYTLAHDISFPEPGVDGLPAAGFDPIGEYRDYNDYDAFAGTLAGGGHTLRNLYINRPFTDGVGLFAVLAADASIDALSLELHLDGVSGYDYVGSLAGKNYGTISNSYASGDVSNGNGLVGSNYGTISNSYASGDVSNGNGLVGSNYGTISNSHTNVNVSGGGGLAGVNGGTISNSSASGDVSGDGHVGGLVAYNVGTISNSHASGDVRGSNSRVGGLVGQSSGNGAISNSSASGDVRGNRHVGGLVGDNFGSTISDSYASGAVSGNSYVGGLVGINGGGTIRNSYANGAVSGNSQVGGLLGRNWSTSTVSHSYWDIQTSGQSASAGGAGRTTAQMMQQATYANWDFSDNGIWCIQEGNDYPRLRGVGGQPSDCNVFSAVGDGSVTLSWVGDANATYYIYQDGVLIATVTGTTYTVRGLVNGRQYTFEVRKADGSVVGSVRARPSLLPPASPTLAVDFAQVKIFRFSWSSVAGATYYRLEENPDGQSGFTTVADNITTTSYDLQVPLFARVNAQYILYACNATGCTASNTVAIADSMADAIGYFKASNTGRSDYFGSVSLHGDTLAVGAAGEDSNATGVDGANQNDNSASGSGAVYVFTRSGSTWRQQAYIKASNTDAGDYFGSSVSLHGDTLAVGAAGEASNATGINPGGQSDNSTRNSGAVYVFTRSNGSWSQQAYIKASNTDAGDYFGSSVSLHGDTLAVGAHGEASNATGINPGGQSDNSTRNSGAVYVFTRSGSTWRQQAYIKASNTGAGDYFGLRVSLHGDTLAVGARYEDSNATGINTGFSAHNNSRSNSGAVYVFTRSGSTWRQQAYIKASNTDRDDEFGYSVSLHGDTLAVGAWGEASNATGIGNNQNNNSRSNSGAVYVFTRSGSTWSQQAYIKASNTDSADLFGSVSLHGDTLAVGAYWEDSNATGIGNNQNINIHDDYNSGAVYVFTRSGSTWSQQAYIKASNTDWGDGFGSSVSLHGDTLAVGATGEDSNATGIGGDQNNDRTDAGAVYVY